MFTGISFQKQKALDNKAKSGYRYYNPKNEKLNIYFQLVRNFWRTEGGGLFFRGFYGREILNIVQGRNVFPAVPFRFGFFLLEFSPLCPVLFGGKGRLLLIPEVQ